MDTNHTPQNQSKAAPVTATAPQSFSVPDLPRNPEKLLTASRHDSVGAAIGIVIIVILLIVGALYFWGAKLEKSEVLSAPVDGK